ncbi:MAG: ATP-binding protein, partial [Rickettsiaceae bacterium]|nr:ATP-binding protein [Rickettsiaceae bacterium]
DQELQMYINIIRRHINDIQKIITEFVDFSKMPTPIFEEQNIVSIIEEIISSRQIINEYISYKFNSTLNEIKFACDVSQIHQMMINLLKNAEEAISRNASSKGMINTIISLDKDELCISIEDNGHGFVQQDIHKIADAYITTSANGAGLGLSIVKKIVYDHSGELVIANNKLGGGLIKLLFPAKSLLEKIKKL